MATDFNKNSITSSGGFKPSTSDTPLDTRTIVETEADITSIPRPFVGMVVYAKDTGKRYEVLTLKDGKSGLTTIKNGFVDTYQELPYVSKEYVEDAIAEAGVGGGNVDISGLATKEELEEVAENDVFKADMKTVSALGGIPAGTDLNGMSIQQVLTKLLYPYVQPTVSASLGYSPTGGVYEFGQTVEVNKMTANVIKKSENITSVKFYVNNVVVDTVTENVAAGGSFVHEFDPAQQVVKTAANSYFKVVATDASGKSVTANTVALNFYYPYYYGVVADGVEITADVVKGLTKQVVAKANKTYSFTSNNQRMVIAYPKAYGVLKSILDPNGFEQIGTFTRTEVSVVGLDGTAQAYYVYANGANTNTNFNMTFKY